MAELEAIKHFALLSAKNVLTINDVEILTGLSKSHLYKLTSRRAIPHYKQAKQLFFDKCEIEAWLKQNKVNTGVEAEQQAISYVVGKGGIK